MASVASGATTSGGKHPSSLYTDALEQWKAVRARLGNIVQEYLEACVTLGNVCAQPPPATSDAHWLDPVFISINAELSSVASEEKKLLQARKELSIFRNRSPTLVSTNRLPPEILLRIFGIVLSLNGCYIQESPESKPPDLFTGFKGKTDRSKYLDVISGVNSYWRQLVISTPAFWSHLDFHLGEDLNDYDRFRETNYFISQARLWVKRARGAPLSVHIFDYAAYTGIDDCSEFVKFLTEHAKQITSLHLALTETTLVQEILSCLLECEGFSGSLKTLVCTHPQRREPAYSIDMMQQSFSDKPFPCNATLNSLLASLRTIHLTNATAQWSGSAYIGLADLRIWGSNFSPDQLPTISQIIGVLRASPRLRTLKLGAMKIVDSATVDLSVRTCVTLDHLEVLDLAWMGSSDLPLLLSALAPGQKPLTMSAKIFHNRTSAIGALKSFFERAKVVTLRMSGRRGWHSAFPHFFGHLPDLRTLVLEDVQYRPRQPAPVWSSLAVLKSDSLLASSLAHYPQLQRLVLVRCVVDQPWLQHLLANNPVKELNMWDNRTNPNIMPAFLTGIVPVVRQTKWHDSNDVAGEMSCFAW
jgi:hypothetical protein